MSSPLLRQTPISPALEAVMFSLGKHPGALELPGGSSRRNSSHGGGNRHSPRVWGLSVLNESRCRRKNRGVKYTGLSTPVILLFTHKQFASFT
jgi:hypothetical protein